MYRYDPSEDGQKQNERDFSLDAFIEVDPIEGLFIPSPILIGFVWSSQKIRRIFYELANSLVAALDDNSY